MSPAEATSPSELRVWFADLEALAPALEAVEQRYGLLSWTERGWSSQPPPETRRWRRLARIALRIVLAHSGAAEARGVEFETDANGKPHLPASALAFNVSHAGSRAIFAVAPHGPVGIDLESERSVALGERRRAMIEAAAVALLRHRRPASFLQAWTCLEAFAKARGSGIGALLTELGITAAGARSLTDADVAARASALISGAGIAVSTLHVPPGCYGSVAAAQDFSAAPIFVRRIDAAAVDLAAARITSA